MNFEIVDNNGQKVDCEVVDLFKDESNNINYIIYTDGTKSENDKLEVYASRYVLENGKYFLKDIENDYEWDLIDNFLASKDKEVG